MANKLQTLPSSEDIPWTVDGLAFYTDSIQPIGAVVRVTRITDGRNGTVYAKIGDREVAFDSKGWLRGGGTWSRTHLKPISVDEAKTIVNKIKAYKLRIVLGKQPWHNVPDEQIFKIRDFLKEMGIELQP